jgi:hypothetical protein
MDKDRLEDGFPSRYISYLIGFNILILDVDITILSNKTNGVCGFTIQRHAASKKVVIWMKSGHFGRNTSDSLM